MFNMLFINKLQTYKCNYYLHRSIGKIKVQNSMLSLGVLKYQQHPIYITLDNWLCVILFSNYLIIIIIIENVINK